MKALCVQAFPDRLRHIALQVGNHGVKAVERKRHGQDVQVRLIACQRIKGAHHSLLKADLQVLQHGGFISQLLRRIEFKIISVADLFINNVAELLAGLRSRLSDSSGVPELHDFCSCGRRLRLPGLRLFCLRLFCLCLFCLCLLCLRFLCLRLLRSSRRCRSCRSRSRCRAASAAGQRSDSKKQSHAKCQLFSHVFSSCNSDAF